MATDDTMACAPIAYPSTQPGLISLSEKEVVKVKEFHHDGFYLVEATSERKTGWVAKSAVRLAVVHRATHLFAETEEPDELPLAENDVVYQLLEPDEEWAYGLVKSQGTSYLTMHDIESPPYLSLSLSLSSHRRRERRSPYADGLLPHESRGDRRGAARAASDLKRALAAAQFHRARQRAGPRRARRRQSAGAGAQSASAPSINDSDRGAHAPDDVLTRRDDENVPDDVSACRKQDAFVPDEEAGDGRPSVNVPLRGQDLGMSTTVIQGVNPMGRGKQMPPPPPPPPPAKKREPAAAPPKEKAKAPGGGRSKEDPKYKGDAPLAAYLWAHNLALISGLALVVCGFFTILWANGKGYKCEINGERIAQDLIYDPDIARGGEDSREYRDCPACAGKDDELCTCCWPNGPQSEVVLDGNVFTGLYAMLLGLVLFVVENTGQQRSRCVGPLSSQR